MNSVLYLGGFELPDKNAAAQRVIAIGKTLCELGFAVSFWGVSKEGNASESTFEGFSCKSISYPTSTKQWIKHIWNFIPINEIEACHPDIVVLYNFPSLASLKILRYCHSHGIKVFHDTTEWEYADGHSLRDIIKDVDTWLRMKYCLRKMDGVIAISRYLYNYYASKVKTVLIPPTVDLKDKKWDRGRELTTGNKVKLIYAGSAGAKSKDRLDHIVEALCQYDNMELEVVGMTQDQYEKDFGSLPDGCNNLIFKGRLPHNEAVKAVLDSDFQMLIREDNLKNRAGFPTKFVESISCCTPLISTLSSNIEDYIIDGKNGFVVDEANCLSKVLERVSRLSIEERTEMKIFCRENNQFDYHNYTEELKKLLS